ncbi:MAG: hypothetical protein WA064_01970 [Candidatus Moraniibacteriota bacterium]
MILQEVKILFDPAVDGGEIQKIFSDDVARTLWLGIRQGHIIERNFKRDILCCAEAIKVLIEKDKLDAEKLFRILSGFAGPPYCHIIGSAERDFAKELLPFVKGEKVINYEIKTEKVKGR